jgi:hypothetical protein
LLPEIEQDGAENVFEEAEAALKLDKLDELKIATSKVERVAGQLTSAMLDPEADAVNSES